MSKILFVISALTMGGSATSLLNMLDLLKERGEEIDLFVMEHTGMFMDRGNESARLLPENKALASAICSPDRIWNYGLGGFVKRGIRSFQNRVGDPVSVRDQLYRRVAARLTGYDVVVSYAEGTATNFARFIPASHRVAWVHTMYDRFSNHISHERMCEVYEAYDDIICVAPAAADAFRMGLPLYADRVSVLPNPLNSELIQTKSLMVADAMPHGEGMFIVQMGRLSPEKQYDLSVRVASRLKREGIPFRWGIIGEGVERSKLESMIREYDVSDVFFLLGAQQNPYPVVAAADVLVITSSYEAQPMVANEALILQVPVITTHYPAAETLLQDRQNGLICPISEEGVHAALKEFIVDEALRSDLKKGAEQFRYDSDSVIDRVLTLLHGPKMNEEDKW